MACGHADINVRTQEYPADHPKKKSTCVFAAQVLAGADRGEEKTNSRAADCGTFCK